MHELAITEGIDRRKIRCNQCDSINFKLIGGKEYYVESLEVE